MKKASAFTVFLIVFIDLIGFGIVLPLLPLFSKKFAAPDWQIGAIMAAYSLMQFVFAPIWGRMSDRIGRRPVLLLSTAAACLSYAVFAVGSGLDHQAGLIVLLVSRLVAGACGANITVAQAYIADVTPPEKRSARMGLIGMAFGLGFVFGPVLGGFALKFWGMAGPGWVAAAICAVNLIFSYAVLKESRTPSSTPVSQRPPMDQWRGALLHPRIGLLIGVFFLATFCFTCFETTLGLLVSRNFHLDVLNPEDTSRIVYLYAYCGVLGAFIQGGATGRLIKLVGEPGLIILSLGLVAISFTLLPFARSWPSLLGILAVLAAGSSLTRPPVFGMISTLTVADEQGATLGVAQGVGSLARILGPIFAGSLFGVTPALPYLICTGVLLLAAWLTWRRLIDKRQVLAP